MSYTYLHNVTTLKLNQDKCTGCGICVQVCPHHVFELQNKKAEIVDLDACMECGACRLNCAFDAIDVRSVVGCATALLMAKLKGTEPTCGCQQESCC